MSTPVTKKPKYLHVADQIRSEIASGHWSPGQMLPIESKLADSLGMARNTVRQGLSELERDGIIERVQGRGTFVTTRQQRSAKEQLSMFALISDQLREGFYPSLVHGFEDACQSIQHSAIVCNSDNDVHVQGDLILQMIDRNVAGVALVPTTATPTPVHHIRQIQKHQIPVVFCHRSVSGVSAPCVTWDGEEVGRLAAEAFLEQGHDRIVCLTPHQGEMSDAYLRGIQHTLASQDKALPKAHCVHYGARVSSADAKPAIRSALKELYESNDRPTAIFCGMLPDAEQIYFFASELGWRMPEDLSLIYFGGTWRNSALAERIACIAVDEQAVGAKAAQLLEEMRFGNRPIDNDERIVMPVSLLDGETMLVAQ